MTGGILTPTRPAQTLRADPTGTSASTSESGQSRGFRGDIEGLRAIAVLAVMVYHLWPRMMPGGFVGVDIFFVISGFLITTDLAREHLRTGTISLPMFYARRALRLIPAATATLVGTAIAAALFVPRAYWTQFGNDIVAAAFYGVNWTLANQSVDYLAEDVVESPVQHFWSLAVEEQYYLVWPLLMIGAGLLAARAKRSRRGAFVAMGLLVTVGSAGWAMYQFHLLNPAAYFVTTTRLWELALGSVLAIAYPWLAARRWGQHSLGAFGLVAVAASLWVIPDPQQWPNPWTFLPILATAVVIGAGGGPAPTHAERVLSLPSLVWIGGLSYALYLWHWPLIMVSKYVVGDPGIVHGVAIVVASFLLAWLTRIALENPIRFHPKLRSRARYGLIVGLVGAVVSASVGYGLAVAGSFTDLRRAVHAPGAVALRYPVTSTPIDRLTWSEKAIDPLPHEAREDVPVLYADDCHEPKDSSEVKVCTYGYPSAKRTIAMVGDSKIMQWQSAIDRIARERRYKLIVLTKNACAFSDSRAMRHHQPYPVCDEWRDQAFAELKKHQPDIVFTSQMAAFAYPEADNGPERLVSGLARMYTRLNDEGFRVAVIGDNPRPPEEIPACMQNHAEDPGQCAFPKELHATGFPSQDAAVARIDGTVVNADAEVTRGENREIVLLDMNDTICPPQLNECPTVLGDTLMYRQGTHLTKSYVDSLKPRLSRALDAAGLFDR